MIWWVYNQVKKNSKIQEVCVATDDDRIALSCDSLGINYIMTSSDHPTSTDRLHEVSKILKYDLYICVNGDEPLIDPETIDCVIPDRDYFNNMSSENPFVSNLMVKIKNAADVVDFTNIKVVVDHQGYALYMSRSPIPYPKGYLEYDYYKHVGVLSYNKSALDFFVSTKKGLNELIEDVNELRFIENNVKVKMISVNKESLSVDTPKDLEFIKKNMIF